MKLKKSLFLAVLLLLIFAVCFSLASCGDDEEPPASSKPSTEESKNNDSKPGDNNQGGTEEHIHDFDIKVTKYPTSKEQGAKKYICKDAKCGYSYEEKIESLSVSLPQVTKLLAPLFESGAVSFKVEEDTELIYAKELADYSNLLGTKGFLTIEIAETEFKQNDGNLAGHIKFAFNMAEVELDGNTPVKDVVKPGKSDEFGALYVYVNGEDISVELTSKGANDQKLVEKYNYKASELLCMAIGEASGLNTEMVMAMGNICVELKTYLPLLGGIVNTSIEAIPLPQKLPESFGAFAKLLGEAAISENTDANGNTVYTLDIAAINEFLKKYDGKTIKDVIDSSYGEGATDSLVEFAKKLPDMKLKEIATKAIAFAENYGVDIETTYELINYIIYLATDENTIDVGKEIEKRYEDTLAELVAEISGVDKAGAAEFAKNIKDTVDKFAKEIPTYTIDDIYSLITGDETTKITETLHAFVAQLDEVTNVSVTIDKDGKPVSATFEAGPVAISFTANGDDYVVTITNNGVKVFEGKATIGENIIKISGNVTYNESTLAVNFELSDNFASFVVEGNGSEIIKLNASFKENEVTFNGKISYGGETVIINSEIRNKSVTLTISDGEKTLLDFNVSLDENGTPIACRFIANGYFTSYDENGEKTETFENIITFNYDYDAALEAGEILLSMGQQVEFSFDFDKKGLNFRVRDIDEEKDLSTDVMFEVKATYDENGKLNGTVLANGVTTIYDSVTGEATSYKVEKALTGTFSYDVEAKKLTLALQAYDTDNETGVSYVCGKVEAEVVFGEYEIASFKMDIDGYSVAGAKTELATIQYKCDENGIEFSVESPEDDVEITFKETILDNGVSFSVYARQGAEVFADAALSITAVNEENKKSLTIDVDFGKLPISDGYEYVEITDEYGDVIDYLEIGSTEYIVIDTSITFAWEKAE